MLQEFTLNRGRAIINFSLKYCDNRQKILSSYAFHRVVESFIFRIKKDNQQLVKKEDYNQPYGYCPICSIPGMNRERRINGNDMCFNGHIYLSRDAVYPK